MCTITACTHEPNVHYEKAPLVVETGNIHVIGGSPTRRQEQEEEEEAAIFGGSFRASWLQIKQPKEGFTANDISLVMMTKESSDL